MNYKKLAAALTALLLSYGALQTSERFAPQLFTAYAEEQSSETVTNEQIFEYLYGRPYADVEYEPIDIRAYVLYSADEENIESYDSFCFETAKYRYFEGGHFFIHEHCDEMASFINKTISVNTRVRV